jgi:ribosomal protein L37AE/L43A
MPQLSPYFKALARDPGMCPECGGRLRLQALERTWDAAVWRCGACGWLEVAEAPASARMGPRGEGPGARVIIADFGK